MNCVTNECLIPPTRWRNQSSFCMDPDPTFLFHLDPDFKIFSNKFYNYSIRKNPNVLRFEIDLYKCVTEFSDGTIYFFFFHFSVFSSI